MCEGLPFDFDTLAKKKNIQSPYYSKTSERFYDIFALMDLLNHTKGSLRQMELQMLCLLFRK
jgi:hypothetical protein